MATAAFPLEDYELEMPNGVTLAIVSGELPVSYHVRPAEPDVGIPYSWVEWDADCREISVTAIDEDENEIRLVLPLSNPAVRDLLHALDSTVADYCMSDDHDAADYDYGAWEAACEDHGWTKPYRRVA